VKLLQPVASNAVIINMYKSLLMKIMVGRKNRVARERSDAEEL
jgi:hypothetical protein